MRKIFILGGSALQLDLILEAKKMFFYTIVLDMDENCIGSKWCDEFLHINIANKELVLQKAREYKIGTILTSATELGNVTACYVGEKLGLNTNSYQTALNTTNKVLMKELFVKNNLQTAKYVIINKNKEIKWEHFPCIVKPSDSSAGRGLTYCTDKAQLKKAFIKAKSFSNTKEILLEEYIEGKQYSIETISCNGNHQVIAINDEEIHSLPTIIEMSHTIPSHINKSTKKNIMSLIPMILDDFNIRYGACHIELRVTSNGEIYIIELASRTGGMRSEMINLAYGINYSQLLLLSSLNILTKIKYLRNIEVKCNFIINNKAYEEYIDLKNDSNYIIFEPNLIENIKERFSASHLGESKGYYFLLKREELK